MSVLGYARLDNDSAVQRREMRNLIKDYALSIGLEKFNGDFVFEDGCDITESLEQRPGFRACRDVLHPGDTLIVPFLGSICGHPSSFEKFLKHCLARDIRVFCLETRSDLTATVGAIGPLLRVYAQWESRLIAAEQKLADRDELHEAALAEYSKMAVEAAVHRLMKADIAGALSEAMKQATAQAGIYASRERRPTYRETVSKRTIEHLEKTNPGILDQPFPG